jgi:ferredoxin-nitrate reductase
MAMNAAAGAPERIGNPWAERTPYGRASEWPVRVDTQLEEGIETGEVEDWVQSASVHSNGDALDIAVKEGRIVGVRRREADRVNRGRLGPKDLYGWQADASPDRLTRPLIREAGVRQEL